MDNNKSTIAVAMNKIESAVATMSLRISVFEAHAIKVVTQGHASQHNRSDCCGRQWCEWKCVSTERDTEEGMLTPPERCLKES